MDTPSNSAPAALADLIAAGLVSHEMIGDPARLGGEAAALKALCGLVAGPVWRIEPFHYAFRAGARRPGGAAAAALEAALAAALGPEAAWVNPTEPAAAAAPEAALLLLRGRGRGGARGGGAGGARGVLNAGFAAAAARLAAGAEGGALAERLAAIEARQAAILAALDGRDGAPAPRLAEALRPGARAAGGAGAAAARPRGLVAGRLAELAAMAGDPGRLPGDARADPGRVPRRARAPRRDAEPRPRVPQFS